MSDEPGKRAAREVGRTSRRQGVLDQVSRRRGDQSHQMPQQRSHNGGSAGFGNQGYQVACGCVAQAKLPKTRELQLLHYLCSCLQADGDHVGLLSHQSVLSYLHSLSSSLPWNGTGQS